MMTPEQQFSEELGGISATEVGGLLMLTRKPEFLQYSTNSGNKRVRRWKASLLGINIEVTEVEMNPGMGLLTFFSRDYHVENVEWEFTVTVQSSDGGHFWTKSAARAPGKLDGHAVMFTNPWFEGDFEGYRHDLSMIRLMGLSEAA